MKKILLASAMVLALGGCNMSSEEFAYKLNKGLANLDTPEGKRDLRAAGGQSVAVNQMRYESDLIAEAQRNGDYDSINQIQANRQSRQLDEINRKLNEIEWQMFRSR